MPPLIYSVSCDLFCPFDRVYRSTVPARRAKHGNLGKGKNVLCDVGPAVGTTNWFDVTRFSICACGCYESCTADLAGKIGQPLDPVTNHRLADAGGLWSMPGGLEEAVAWLTNHLRDHGISLRGGDIILTGTALGLHHVKPGDSIQVFCEGFGGIEANVVD